MVNQVKWRGMAQSTQHSDEEAHEREWLRVTLSSIGDGVITTDTKGNITFINLAARNVTGWSQEEAVGQPLDVVFKVLNEDTREIIESPAARALREGVVVGLANHSLLIAKDGTERPIDDSAALIRNSSGAVAGVVLVFRDVTLRRQHEREIQDALAYANNIIATLRNPFLVLDKDLRVVTANYAFYKTFQVTPENTQAQFIHELGNGQWNIPKLRALLDDVLPQHSNILDYDVEHDFPIIGRRNFVINVRRIRQPGNHSVLILFALEDVTDRQRADQALRMTEERYRSLMQAISSVVWTTDGDGRFVTPQPLWTEYTGQTWEELRDFGWANALHVDDRQRVWDLWTEACKSKSFYKSEGRMWHAASNSYRHFEARAVPILQSDGSVREWVGKFLDVEELKQTEAALFNSELRYRRLFETAKDGILILDADSGIILDANPFMTELLGYSQAEFVDKELWEIGLFSDKSENEAAFRELQRNGYVRYDHLPLKTKHGQQAEVEFVSNVYQVDHRHVAQCNIRDISERSRWEQKTKEQSEALANLHRLKDEFLAMLSHELRNPLAPISDAVQVLRGQKNDDPRHQQARIIIERQVRQLTRLVDELLEVSRITTGRIHLHEEQVALSNIVENAVETVRALIGQRGHTLKVALPPQSIWLYADAARMEQVIVNLLVNAAKYTDADGQIWLTVEQEGNEAVLRVRDTGVGIPPELLPRVFDLFTQAERSLDRAQGGLGIGLCLVQRLVEMHRGRVEASSELGQGSEFVVRLPVLLTPAQLPPAPRQEIPLEPSGKPLRILMVDDNVDAATALGMRLESSGHDVRIAHSGAAALEAALEQLPDVVLLDIGLPGMSGLEVAMRLRQQSVFKNLMLVAMTGYGQVADRQRSQEAGFDHHLVKPVDFGRLQQILVSVSGNEK